MPRGKAPAKRTATKRTRIEIRLKGGPNAKVFTSLGPARQGSVIELPAVEAEALVEADRAVLSDKDLNVVPLAGYNPGQRF